MDTIAKAKQENISNDEKKSNDLFSSMSNESVNITDYKYRRKDADAVYLHLTGNAVGSITNRLI